MWFFDQNNELIAKYHKLWSTESWPTGLSKRQTQILSLVREQGTCSVADLAQALDVSFETVRRDIKPLVDSREVSRRHGSIALPHELGEAPFERRLREHFAAKRAIARRAARLIEDGDSLMLDTGTTTSIFARELLKKRDLTVVTNSSDIARTLATVNGNRVYMAGGELNGSNGAAFGPSAIAFAASFPCQTCYHLNRRAGCGLRPLRQLSRRSRICPHGAVARRESRDAVGRLEIRPHCAYQGVRLQGHQPPHY